MLLFDAVLLCCCAAVLTDAHLQIRRAHGCSFVETKRDDDVKGELKAPSLLTVTIRTMIGQYCSPNSLSPIQVSLRWHVLCSILSLPLQKLG